VQVLGVDEAAQQQGTAVSLLIAVPTTDVGSLSACGNSSSQFVDYTLDGTSYSITSSDSLTAFTLSQGGGSSNTYIDGLKFSTGDRLSLKFAHTTNVAGTYPLVNMEVQNYTNLTMLQPFNVIITAFPQTIGDFYVGSFSGQFEDASSVTHNITCSFRVLRII
jgi:hypothetical protein